jgi:hypothetical protein
VELRRHGWRDESVRAGARQAMGALVGRVGPRFGAGSGLPGRRGAGFCGGALDLRQTRRETGTLLNISPEAERFPVLAARDGVHAMESS